MKSQIENPNGLHKRYKISKIKVIKNPDFGAFTNLDFYGRRKNTKDEFLVKEVAVDEGSEYFVLRLDLAGSDPEHIKACRIGLHAYANAIQHHLPQLAKELIEKYPLI
jgi:hypothetical protein